MITEQKQIDNLLMLINKMTIVLENLSTAVMVLDQRILRLESDKFYKQLNLL